MKNKVLIIAVIIAFICGLLVGIKLKNLNFATIKEPKEEKKTTLMGLYMTEEKEPSQSTQELKQVERKAITIYNNNTLLRQTIKIYDFEGIGREVIKEVGNSYHYVINNETKSVLLTSIDGKGGTLTLSFSEDFNTIIDQSKNEYTSFKGGIEDYYKEDIGKEREANLEGTFENTNGYQTTTYTFNKDGIVNYKEMISNSLNDRENKTYYYCIKDNKVFIYQGRGNYIEATLSDNNTKLIMNYYYYLSMKQPTQAVYSLKQ